VFKTNKQNQAIGNKPNQSKQMTPKKSMYLFFSKRKEP
jgi:hypothetical protein